MTEAFFSPDYSTARDRFREAAGTAGATLHSLDLTPRGPAGEALSIDIAWFGATQPRSAFVHTTGMHGVEAYTGSAVQLALLDELPRLSGDAALILVHVLNPYGMSWLRRTNDNNVDLNRNHLVDGEAFSGAPPLYATLDPLLNPRSPPSRDAFGLRAGTAVLRHGFSRVKQAVAEGQYEFPRGLFFGGKALQEGPRKYMDWLREHVGACNYVFAVDLHTGLGRHATDTVLPDLQASRMDDLSAALNRTLIDRSQETVAYTVRGGLGSALPRVLAQSRVDFLLQEIGTYGPFRVLHALREENRWHFHGDGTLAHPAKSNLREALCPAAIHWRRQALAHGVRLARDAVAFAFDARRHAM